MNSRFLLVCLFIVACLGKSAICAPADVPEKYKRYFVVRADRRKWYEKALNSINLTTKDIGRSYALIAGVTQYPNLPPVDRTLQPADVDIKKLESYLETQEFFDEIVVLKDGDMNWENLHYFLDVYFPQKLESPEHTRFLFAYSGHGYAQTKSNITRGFLLTSSAVSRNDPINSIDLAEIREMLKPTIDAGEKVLVLINACNSGAFIGRSFGPGVLDPGVKGAFAILASRKDQNSLHLDDVGPGSVFFEKIFAGLGGAADKSPPDGIITYYELVNYLHDEIPLVTNNTQQPTEGNISSDGSEGQFFFLNRARQVQLGNAHVWKPGDAVQFGSDGEELLEAGIASFDAQRYEDAFSNFNEAAFRNNLQAMVDLGYMFEHGKGTDQSFTQAFEWYGKAAARRNAYAMYRLGSLYEEGRGVTPDRATATDWFEKAAGAGNSDAMNILGDFHNYTGGWADAKVWYEKAATAGNRNAMASLARIYETGQDSIPKDLSLAREWYNKAAKAGSQYAEDRLEQLPDKQ